MYGYPMYLLNPRLLIPGSDLQYMPNNPVVKLSKIQPTWSYLMTINSNKNYLTHDAISMSSSYPLCYDQARVCGVARTDWAKTIDALVMWW